MKRSAHVVSLSFPSGDLSSETLQAPLGAAFAVVSASYGEQGGSNPILIIDAPDNGLPVGYRITTVRTGTSVEVGNGAKYAGTFGNLTRGLFHVYVSPAQPE